MGRRKIEIKAIKDDRNRSVTFLKRKGGLFKKAHELSVLCSVDVAVFVFGNNKKLYEYSSIDMRELIARYQYHGGPSEHKGPSDFNGGANDDDDDDDADGTPPRGLNGIDSHMLPPHFGGQTQPPPPPPFSQVRHHTASASPPMTNGGFPGRQPQLSRGHTPQPSVGSRPGSRNDMRQMAMGRGMTARQPVAPLNGPHPGMTYMNAPPPMYSQPSTLMPPGAPFAYQPQQPHQQTPYLDERRSSGPPSFPSHQTPPAQSVLPASRAQSTASPPQSTHHQQPPSHIHHPSPQPERRHLDIQHPPPPPPPQPKVHRLETPDRHRQPFSSADMTVKKMPQRKSHSIFTPIEENRSILSLHLASFASDPPIKMEQPEPGVLVAASASGSGHRSSSSDSGPSAQHGVAAPGSMTAVVATAAAAGAGAAAAGGGNTPSPLPARQSSARNSSVSSAADMTASPPAQSNNVKVSVPAGGRARGPRLTVQIPDGSSEVDSATGGSISPRNVVESPAQVPARHNSTAMVLPPPSPSAQTLLSAGAIGPPNPFARPPPQQNISGETPVSALPSRFLNNELLPSPNSFYPEWNLRAADSNTLPSPLNFTTPVVGVGPSFLRDDVPSFSNGITATSTSSTTVAVAATSSTVSVPTITTTAASDSVTAQATSGLGKRKSLESTSETSHEVIDTLGDAKRLRVN